MTAWQKDAAFEAAFYLGSIVGIPTVKRLSSLDKCFELQC